MSEAPRNKLGQPKDLTFVRMFKPQFADMVQSGAKCQTVRPTPKRTPKPGDRISLRAWTGKPYRSKQRILREAEVCSVDRVRIDSGAVWPNLWINGQRLNAQATSQFAVADGFLDPQRMGEWFEEHHGLPFEGIVIHWSNAEAHSRGGKS